MKVRHGDRDSTRTTSMYITSVTNGVTTAVWYSGIYSMYILHRALSESVDRGVLYERHIVRGRGLDVDSADYDFIADW
jgi:hypothetical protein